jgi:hypothetical protein
MGARRPLEVTGVYEYKIKKQAGRREKEQESNWRSSNVVKLILINESNYVC